VSRVSQPRQTAKQGNNIIRLRLGFTLITEAIWIAVESHLQLGILAGDNLRQVRLERKACTIEHALVLPWEGQYTKLNIRNGVADVHSQMAARSCNTRIHCTRIYKPFLGPTQQRETSTRSACRRESPDGVCALPGYCLYLKTLGSTACQGPRRRV
jgi:hypothetical protein